MNHQIDVFCQNQMAALRNLSVQQSVQNSGWIIPEVYFSWDDENADVSIDLKSQPGQLFNADISVTGDPRWFTFNIGLGLGVMTPDQRIMVSVHQDLNDSEPVPFLLRSRLADAIFDVAASPQVKVQNELHSRQFAFGAGHPFLGQDAYHTLLFRLPKRVQRFALLDLRVSVVDAANLTSPALLTLGQFGARKFTHHTA